MIVAIPFHPSLTDFDKYAKAIAAKGQCKGHALLVVSQRQHEEEALAFATEAGKAFDSVETSTIDAVTEGGAIGITNALFKAAVYFYRKWDGLPGEQGDAPLLYNDPTWTPRKQGWLDAIQSEYFARGGPKVLAWWRTNDQGEKITRGPVVFNKEYALDAPLLPHLPAGTHWRIYMRHELGNIAVASETIAPDAPAVLRPVRTPQPKEK
jgi:hypothetical protein